MRKSPLIELLEAFTTVELAEFQLFVRSPYFNRGEFCDEAPLLLQALMNNSSPEWRWEEETRRVAYTAVFPGMPFIEGKLEKVMSLLHRLARLFISLHSKLSQADDFQQTLELARFSRKRALQNRFRNTMQKLREQFGAADSGEDIRFFKRRFQIELEEYEYENLLNHKRGDINIPRTIEALDMYYFSLKSHLLNNLLLQQRVTFLGLNGSDNPVLNDHSVPGYLAEKSAVLRVSSAFLEVLRLEKPAKEQFHALAMMMLEAEGKIHPDLLKDYYSFLRSCCILLVNSGHLDYLPTLFDIQKEHLRRGYLYYDQKIPAAMFQNIINVALRVGEYDWAFQCIQSHAGRIIGDNDQQDYYRLNLANYFFHTGRFDEALDVLPQTLADVEYHLMARRLELKIYYSQHSDLLSYKIDAFKMYLSRSFLKPLPAIQKERNGNFVNLLLQLSHTAKGDQTRVQRLLTRIRTKTWVTERDWLLEKTAELL